MSIIKAGRSAIAGALSFAMLMAAPVQTFADEVADYTCAEETTLDLDSADMYAFKIIKQGSSGTAVREIQRRLSELGYFNNPITGNFGSITKQAVTAFQIKCGLIADGIVGETTYNRLFADDAPKADAAVSAPTAAPTAAPADDDSSSGTNSVVSSSTPEFSGVLKTGSVGEAVKQMQRRLSELGYLNGTADGAFGKNTAAAVKAFQIKCGITVDGTLNFETYIRLYSDEAPSAGSEAAAPAPTQAPDDNWFIENQPATATPTIIPTPVPTPTSAPTNSTSVAFPGTLSKGNTGAAVKQLQKRLIELNYLTGAADGAFGNATKAAVKAFQAARGLNVTGDVDQLTHNALYSSGSDTPAGDNFVEISRGSTGEAVKTLQQRLTALGYYSGSLQGTFGALTEAALIDFQSTAGLTRTGVLDKATYTLLYSPRAPYKEGEDGDYTELKMGDMGSDVKKLQQRLIDLKFLNDNADGYFGGNTQTAVKAFQIACGISVTGVATMEMQERLFAYDAPMAGTATATPAPSAAPAATAYPELKTGSVGANVKTLQRRLIELKLLTGSADGAYGAKTAAAVKTFQISVGLEATGIADSATQIALYTGNLPTVTPAPTATATPDPDATPAPTYTILKSGSTGEAVKKLQERLKELGYYTATVNSIYDSNTVNAVKSFQKGNQISVDGVAGTQTQTRLYSDDAVSYDEAGDRADVESNTPSEVAGSAPHPVIGEIEDMDWFENTDGFLNRSHGTFKDGTTAVVTDVKTGISFTIRRLGGKNHADSEPLIEFDSWQIYRLYGGKWSWTRRAIIVTVGGKNIAASMNGMPHGGESISNNSFVGHFCIHFTNSRTHGTNRVDPDHQAAVKTALAADVSALNARIQAQ